MKSDKICWYEMFSDRHKKTYNVNKETGVSQWGLPTTLKTLPDGWEMHLSNNILPGNYYYSHKKTNHVQWKDPSLLYKDEKKSIPFGWEEKKSTCDNVYYINKKEKKSQWQIPTIDKPKSFTFVIPPDDEVEIVASVEKGIRKSVVKKVQPLTTLKSVDKKIKTPGALKWDKNSCYLDSALFAFFAGPREFIYKMLNEDIEQNIDIMIPNVCYINNEKKDIESRKRVQEELRKIYGSIMGTGPKVDFCTDLRNTFRNCLNSERYDKGGIGDSGEFITYLLSILSFEPSTININKYATNRLGPNFEKIIEEKDVYDVYESSKIEILASPVHVIASEIIEGIGDDQMNISDFLIRVNDTGTLEQKYLFSPEDGTGRKYQRVIETIRIEYTPYLIFSLKRVTKENPNKIITNRVIPDALITLGDNQDFSLSAAVMHTGRSHYVAIAKYNGVWWYYNDSEYLHNKPLVQYNSFEDFIFEVENKRSNKINPLTHGTQFYYTPVNV